MNDIVEYHSGYVYAERPITISWLEKRWEVKEILSQCHTPEGKFFRVCTQNNQIFELLYKESEDIWQIKPL